MYVLVCVCVVQVCVCVCVGDGVFVVRMTFGNVTVRVIAMVTLSTATVSLTRLTR